MNILIGSNVHWWNAEAAYAAATAEQLQKLGHQVWVLTRPNTLNHQQLQKRNLSLVTHIDLNTSNPWKLYQSYEALKAFVQENQIQVLNPHRSEGFFLYGLLKQAQPQLKLIKARGTTRTVLNTRWNRWLYDQVDAHVCAGQVVLERLQQNFTLPANQCHVIYYPLSENVPQDTHNYHNSFEIPSNHQTLAIVGRLGRIKGHHLLFNGFKQLLSTHPQCTLLVIHKHADPQWHELQMLKAYAEELGISDNLRFIGPREDLLSLMKWVDLGVVSSLDSEVICRVAMEFYSVGTPIVACPTGCLPELIENGVSGHLLPQISVPDLSQTLAQALDHFPQQVHSYAQKFSVTNFQQQWQSLLT